MTEIKLTEGVFNRHTTIFKQGEALKYSVSDSRTGKLLHAGSVGKLSDSSYCHEKITGRAVKLGVLSFHKHCY